MPTYNADKSLEKALNSVLNQKYTNWELIVIENGKKGRAEEICNSYQNEKIKYKLRCREKGFGFLTHKYYDFG